MRLNRDTNCVYEIRSPTKYKEHIALLYIGNWHARENTFHLFMQNKKEIVGTRPPICELNNLSISKFYKRSFSFLIVNGKCYRFENEQIQNQR